MYKRFRPGAMAYEDRELIGTGKSITEYRKGEVKKFVTKMKYSKIKLLCGAGINSAEDIREAYNLGCRGILISSAIAKVQLKKAEKLLREICRLKQI